MANPVPGFPDETNTGVSDGVALSAYSGPSTIRTDGAVIENKTIDGSLRIEADNVTIRNCVINYDGWWGIDAEGAANIRIENCEIVGPGYNGDSNAGILGSGTFLNNNIYHSENGIVLTGGASTVRGNYIHDLQDRSGDPHYDGIAAQGGQYGVLIEGNTIVSRDTSNVFIKNDFGPINDVTVRDNLLYGDAGYIVYVDARADGGPITGVSITGNYIEEGFYGTFSVDKSSPSISGNTMFVPGEEVAQPAPDPEPQPEPEPQPDPEPEPDPQPQPEPDNPAPGGSGDGGGDGSIRGDVIRGSKGSDKLEGTQGNDRIYGKDGHDRIDTGDGNDILLGDSGNDRLYGGDGDDHLIGGRGADMLNGGGGADLFIFRSLWDSGLSYRSLDTIQDFSQEDGDRIDLSAIDAKSGWGNQSFSFIGESDFSQQKGELRYVTNDSNTFVYGDVNGDARADFTLKLVGVVDLHAVDFVV